jgi:hypothetical protein
MTSSRPKPVNRFLNRPLHLLPFRDIERHGDRLFAFLGQTVRNGFGLCAIDVRDGDRGAFLSESPSDALAETLSAAGDNRNLIAKTIHCVFSPVVNPAVRSRTYSGDPCDSRAASRASPKQSRSPQPFTKAASYYCLTWAASGIDNDPAGKPRP